MGKRKNTTTTKKIVCPGCGTKADPLCTWHQGRCPHRTPIFTGNIMNHKNVSLIKSTLRIVACYFLAYCSFQEAAILLAVAEGLGILEELV